MTPRLPDLELRTLTAAFDRVLAERPDAVAHIERSGSWTYAQAYDRCLHIAGGLAGLGAAAEETVATFMDNSFDTVHTLFGLGLTSRVQVPINTAYKGRFLSHLLNDTRAKTLVIEGHYCGRLRDIADEVPELTTVIVRGGDGEDLPAGRFRVVPFTEVVAHDPAAARPAQPWDQLAIVYTSGTTGPSKGVRVPHAQAYTYASREDDERSGPDDRTLVVLPMFHLAGQMFGIYQSLIAGGSCVLEPVFSLSRFWDTVHEHGITDTVLLGAMAQMITQAPARADEADNPLRLVQMAPLVADVAGFSQRFDVEVASVYGSTESGCPIVGRPDSIVGGECGYPRAGFQCRVVDEHDREVPLGTVGELAVRADLPWTLSDGYHNQPAETVATWRNGWLHTGDAFRADSTGRLFFVDRITDTLRRRGENISSFEVEQVIDQHPAVFESAVVAVPSELSEDEVKAVIVARDGAEFDPAGLIKFLTARLPYFMIPRYVQTIDEMPRTPTQKIRKDVLRKSGTAGSAIWDRDAAGFVINRHS